MGIGDWLRRVLGCKPKVEPGPEVTLAHAERVTGGEVAEMYKDRPPAEPDDIVLSVLDYIADMLSDKRLIPSYLREEMAAARGLPAVAWDMARKQSNECPSAIIDLRGLALEHARQVSNAVLRAQKG